EEWHFIANDPINMDNNDNDDINMENNVSDDMNMDNNGDNNNNDDDANFDMEEYYHQNWIAAESESSECSEDSGICMRYDDDADDDTDDDYNNMDDDNDNDIN
ncbi:hypothetical protein PV327_011278, partial [Microctonus hyperodae]